MAYQCLAFSPDGARIAAADGRNVGVCDAASGDRLLTLAGHDAEVLAVAYSIDGTRLATAGKDKTARILDAMTGQELARLSGHTARIAGVAFSPDGARLATASWDVTARVWDIRTGPIAAQLTR